MSYKNIHKHKQIALHISELIYILVGLSKEFFEIGLRKRVCEVFKKKRDIIKRFQMIAHVSADNTKCYQVGTQHILS
jgi:hypothetical protein